MSLRYAQRGTARNAVRRIVLTWFINALALKIMSNVLGGFSLNGFGEALAVAAVLGLLNAILWPLFIRFALPVTVLTLGLASMLVNGLFVVVAINLLPNNNEVSINGWQTGVWVALGVTVINALFTRLLAIDDDDFYYRNVVRRMAARQKYASSDKTDRTGIVFLEIDGLAHDVLQRAVRAGYAPNMSRWLRQGDHHLLRWECDWSSQTGAMQAGILHGSNFDMPSFRWFEKDKGKAMVSNHPDDAVEIERRHSNGKGLLHYDGASNANLLSGDAPHSMLTMSTVRKSRKTSIGQDYAAFFTNPYSALRVFVLVIIEIFKEIRQQTVQKRRDIRPRVHRGWFPYPLLRSFTNVLQRELGMSATMQGVFAGRPVIYSMFLGYDEVAHHSGTERPETLAELEKIDRAFGRLELALQESRRPYKIVVLSDHGQTQGATFKQRYGQSLEELIKDLTHADTRAAGQGEEGRGMANAAAAEMHKAGGSAGFLSHFMPRFKSKEADIEVAEVAVMPSGALGSVSFIKQPGRVTLEQINELYPGLVDELVNHEGVGFILVRSTKDGDLAIGKQGTHYLKTGKIEGGDPLEPFGPNAAEHVKRTSSFPHCPDLVINSTYWQETEEVAAFEELVGSHGAMGGTQQYPFVLYPSELNPPASPIVGAENVHKQFKKWLAGLGWEAYKN